MEFDLENRSLTPGLGYERSDSTFGCPSIQPSPCHATHKDYTFPNDEINRGGLR